MPGRASSRDESVLRTNGPRVAKPFCAFIRYRTRRCKCMILRPMASAMVPLALFACSAQPGSHMGSGVVTAIRGATALIGPELRRVDGAVILVEGDEITVIG